MKYCLIDATPVTHSRSPTRFQPRPKLVFGASESLSVLFNANGAHFFSAAFWFRFHLVEPSVIVSPLLQVPKSTSKLDQNSHIQR